MKYGIIGDVHGTSLSELERRFDDEGIDVVICLGDFDPPRIIHQFIELERKYRKKGKKVLAVPGNHDHAILTDLGISSETLRRQGYESWQLHDELMKDEEAREYIKKLLDRRKCKASLHGIGIYLDKEKFGNLYRTIIVHGGLYGSLDNFPDCPDDIRDLWFRLEKYGQYFENFLSMKRNRYRIMIRGHDHSPLYVCQDSSSKIKTYIPAIPEHGRRFELDKDKRHVINPGILFYGNFAVIDTSGKKPILEFKQL